MKLVSNHTNPATYFRMLMLFGLSVAFSISALAEPVAKLRDFRPMVSADQQEAPSAERDAEPVEREADRIPSSANTNAARPPLAELLNSKPGGTIEHVKTEPLAAVSPAREPKLAPAPIALERPVFQEPGLDDLATESGQHRRALAEFLEVQNPVKLRRPEATYTFDIPVSPRMEVTAAETEIRYANSISLREDISQMAVSWNETLLAQVPLMKQSPNGRIREVLPGAPFEGGYLPLRINVAQHYARNNECEDPSSPVLWTQIDPHESWISMDYHLRPLNPVLSDLGELIDPRLWSDYELTIVTSPTYSTDDDRLQWGALVAQRAALFLNFKPLKMRHATQIRQTGDQVVIGTRNELGDILPAEILAEISEGFIGIYPNPLSPEYFLLVLSGYDKTGVDRAVRAMALYNDALPAAPSMDVNGLDIPESAAYETDRVLVSREKVNFSELGFETDTRMGMTAEAFGLEFSIPPDFYAPENATVDFRLHFAHGAALREDSVFNVLLNGRFESAIYLKEEEGAVYRDYRVEIPLRSFQPGKNRVTLEPQMVPFRTGHCELIQEENLLFTLFDDSELKLPSADHYVRLPDLDLFGKTAFPSSVDPRGKGFAIHVASPDSETMASAWMIAGKIAQIVGQPLIDLEVTGNIPAPDRHWIAVGTIADMSPDLLAGAPVQFGKNGQIPAILARIPAERAGMQEERRMVEGVQTSMLRGSNSAGNKGVFMQFQSPFADDKAGMLVTAEDRVTLRQRVGELIQPGVWGGLKGDTMVWYGAEANLRSQRLGDSFYLGEPGFGTAAAYQLSAHPWFGIVLALAGVAMLALFAKRALAKFQRRHHGRSRPEGQAAVEPG